MKADNRDDFNLDGAPHTHGSNILSLKKGSFCVACILFAGDTTKLEAQTKL